MRGVVVNSNIFNHLYDLRVIGAGRFCRVAEVLLTSLPRARAFALPDAHLVWRRLRKRCASGQSTSRAQNSAFSRQAILDGYKAALNADMVAFKTNRAGYIKEFAEKINAARTEDEEKKAGQQLLTPIKRGR